jgi:hypothetical protein
MCMWPTWEVHAHATPEAVFSIYCLIVVAIAVVVVVVVVVDNVVAVVVCIFFLFLLEIRCGMFFFLSVTFTNTLAATCFSDLFAVPSSPPVSFLLFCFFFFSLNIADLSGVCLLFLSLRRVGLALPHRFSRSVVAQLCCRGYVVRLFFLTLFESIRHPLRCCSGSVCHDHPSTIVSADPSVCL